MSSSHATVADRNTRVQLAFVEVLSALTAIHSRFCAELPKVVVPELTKSKSNKSEVQRQEARKRVVDRLSLRSTELTACDHLEAVDEPIKSYTKWLSGFIEHDLDGEMAYEAARVCIKPVRELHSIFKIARPFPENAAKRARMIAKRMEN